MTLSIGNLRKTYRPHHVALDGIALEADAGTLGLLGPNGAGKSSLMEILAGNMDFDSGVVTLDGVDLRRQPPAWRRLLGYMPQGFDFPPRCSARSLMEEMATLLGLSPRAMAPRIGALLDRVNLSSVAHREAASFSRGMKQRLGLAMALLHQPRLLLLDEPTAGLDPRERVAFRDLLADNAAAGVVLLATHIVPDVEHCCARVAVIARGRLLYHGSTPALAAMAEGMVWECIVPADAVEEIARRETTVGISPEGHGHARVRLLAPQPPAPDATPAAPRLEDGYLWLLSRHHDATAPLVASL